MRRALYTSPGWDSSATDAGGSIDLREMILCITPNPAIDRTLILPSLTLGKVHRVERLIVAAGGKGLNVARTVRILGGEPFCMGFAGGHSGRLLADRAKTEGLNASWTWTDSETRTCTILVPSTGEATQIDEPGAPVLGSDWKRLREDVRKHIPAASLVCVSGSLPPAPFTEDFTELLQMLVDAGKQVWVDTSRAALDAALNFPRTCIKVNGDEIGRALGCEVNDVTTAKQALAMLGDRGLAACVITLGSSGALLAAREGRWHAQGPVVRVVSTVGSGDAFLGGLVCALDRGMDWPDALRDAIAAGTANALSAGGGQFTLQEFRELREQIHVEVW